MLRLLSYAVVLLPIAALSSACRGPCAQGPAFIESRTVIAAAGSSMDQSFPADTRGDGSGTPLPFVTATDLPSGLTATVDGATLHLRGTIATPGTSDFGVSLHKRQDDACAPWARYDFTVTVE